MDFCDTTSASTTPANEHENDNTMELYIQNFYSIVSFGWLNVLENINNINHCIVILVIGNSN